MLAFFFQLGTVPYSTKLILPLIYFNLACLLQRARILFEKENCKKMKKGFDAIKSACENGHVNTTKTTVEKATACQKSGTITGHKSTAWRVTYEIVTPESSEYGDAEDRGFIDEGCSFRDAVMLISGHATEPSDSHVRYARWFTHHNYSNDFITGAEESRSIHIPDSVSAASRKRIAKLLGCRA